MKVTLDDLAALLPTLEKRDVAVLTRAVLGLRTPEQLKEISLLDRLKAGLWEFMAAVGFVTDAQRRQVLKLVEPSLAATLPAYEAGGTTLPVFHVTFAEQRFVACPMRGAWYDMQFDEDVPGLPEPAVLLVTCDVTALYLRQKAWLARLGRGKDAGPEHHGGGEGPGPDQQGRAGPPAA